MTRFKLFDQRPSPHRLFLRFWHSPFDIGLHDPAQAFLDNHRQRYDLHFWFDHSDHVAYSEPRRSLLVFLHQTITTTFV